MFSAFIKLIKLLPFAAICIAVGWVVADISSDIETLKWLNNSVYLSVAIVAIPTAFAWKVLKSLQALVGHEPMTADENDKLFESVRNRSSLVWELIALYIITVTSLVATRFAFNIISIPFSYLLLIAVCVFVAMSLCSIIRLHAIDKETLYFLSKMTSRDKRKKAKIQALEALGKTDSFSEKEKTHLEKYSSVIELPSQKE